MTMSLPRSLTERAGVALVLGLAVLMLNLSPGHGEDRPEPPSPAALKKARFYGVGYCESCHTKPKPDDPTDFVQLTEYTTWREYDKHSQAYEVLKGERAQRMGKMLGIDVARDELTNACLNCHGMNFPKQRRGTKKYFRITDGVSCDGCHGPAEYWAGVHVQPELWRYQPAEYKTKMGMNDMRDPIVRSEMCLSCHIGDAAHGKVVTHEMYAAGHPPLPGFEIDTFSQELPRHWKPLKDKSAVIRKNFHYDPKQLLRVKTLVIGGVVAMRKAMKLLDAPGGAESASGDSAHRPDAAPDFAKLDCYACHHELQLPSWRQRRGYWGTPGRQSPPAWTMALLPLGVYASARDDADVKARFDEFDQKLQKLHEAFDARPFGDPAKVASAAEELAGWADGLIEKLTKVEFTRSVAQRALSELCTMAQTGTPDYESARQIAWAFRDIDEVLDPKPEPAVEGILNALDKELDLDLPSGTHRKIEAALPARYTAIRQYEPARFQKHFADLAKRLPRE